MHHTHEYTRCCVVSVPREGKVFLLIFVFLAPNFTPIR